MGLLSFITGTAPQSEQDAQLAADEQRLQDALARRAASDSPVPPSILVQDTALTTQANDSELAAAGAGFAEGAKEGLNNVLNAPGQLVGAVGGSAGTLVWGVLKNIPWWVYLGALVFGFFYFGGGILVGRKLREHLQ